MQLARRDGLIFGRALITYQARSTEISDLLLDTGAASTVINADLAAEAGVFLQPGDRLRALRGVGGREYVFVRRVDSFIVGGCALNDFDLEVGEMDYGFEIGGILGMDFLWAAGAVIDLHRGVLRFSERDRAQGDGVA